MHAPWAQRGREVQQVSVPEAMPCAGRQRVHLLSPDKQGTRALAYHDTLMAVIPQWPMRVCADEGPECLPLEIQAHLQAAPPAVQSPGRYRL